MSFATSSSAFGMNKSAAPASNSIFGQSNAAKPAQSLFGGTQPTTTGFGGFGTTNQTQSQPTTQGSSLFGGGFGQNNQTQAQPASTGLFAQPAAAGTQQPQQNTFGSSLFGSTTNNPTQPQNTGQQQNTFGGFNTNPSQQTSNWGSTPSNTLQAQQTLPAINSTFGGSSTAGNSIFGQQRQPSAISPVQPPVTPIFSKSTKFNDLPDEVKKTFEGIDNHIQGRVQISNELKRLKLGQEAVKGQDLIRDIHKELLNVTSTIQSDALFTRDLKHKTEQTVQDTIVATHIVDGFKNPQQNGAYLRSHANFPLEFFNRVTEQMKERLQWYKNTIEQIERRLSSAASQTQSTPQAISATLQAQHATFISLASKTAALDAELQKVKELYTRVWRAKTGSMRDPFNDLDRSTGGDFGMESLRVR
ncbi:hypothetical protein SERLA73DRAFT_152622 [Serpula lacrymans var. lacrymans S7.3]|uniref:Nucleoporin Nup54 alpha-helical domain-containing protein n=1 Tax=Serpula lacrymans var. lacrymans (strain S7.3) TaxID=936435 RepID=F8PY50_SERL3|nr:hypothetical protein SERLA73DRAFT_152622 [Serpula lacrymans var. lacrymans S7.3]